MANDNTRISTRRSIVIQVQSSADACAHAEHVKVIVRDIDAAELFSCLAARKSQRRVLVSRETGEGDGLLLKIEIVRIRRSAKPTAAVVACINPDKPVRFCYAGDGA